MNYNSREEVKNLMTKFCNEIEKAFVDYLEQGYGHADEQLFSVVYFRRPELFDVYFGDYFQMIRNYVWIKEAPQAPLRNLIQNSFNHKDYEVCKKGCKVLLDSIEKGYTSLNSGDITRLVNIYNVCNQN